MYVWVRSSCRVIEANQIISPVVTLSVPDRELLERNEFRGDGLTVAEQV